MADVKHCGLDAHGRDVVMLVRDDGRTIYLVTGAPKGASHWLGAVEHVALDAVLETLRKAAPKCDQPDCFRAAQFKGERWHCAVCEKIEAWARDVAAVDVGAYELRVALELPNEPDAEPKGDSKSAEARVIADKFKVTLPPDDKPTETDVGALHGIGPGTVDPEAKP